MLSYDFHTFGHAVRDVTTSRGNKEGDNAFLHQDGELYHFLDGSNSRPCFEDFIEFAFKKNLSPDFTKWAFQTLDEQEVS